MPSRTALQPSEQSRSHYPQPGYYQDARLNSLLASSLHQVGRVQHHILLKHTLNELVKWVGLGIRHLVTHPDRGHESDDSLSTRVEHPVTRFGQLFPQRWQPSPVREDLATPYFSMTSKTGELKYASVRSSMWYRVSFGMDSKNCSRSPAIFLTGTRSCFRWFPARKSSPRAWVPGSVWLTYRTYG